MEEITYITENYMNVFDFRPVGQGLFYTGSLNGGKFNFVYDCGTENNKKYIEKNIDNYISSLSGNKFTKPKIDFVVISHLHKDHFSGLFYLLQKSNVKKIYLPYLGEDRTVILSALALTVFGESEEDNPERSINDVRNLFFFTCSLYGVGNENYGLGERVAFIRERLPDFSRDENYDYFSETLPVKGREEPFWQFNFIQRAASAFKLNQLGEEVRLAFGEVSEGSLSQTMLSSEGNISRLQKIYEGVFGAGNALNLTSLALVHFPLSNIAMSVFLNRYFDCGSFFKPLQRNLWNEFISEINHEILRTSYITATLLTGDAMLDDGMARLINSALGGRDILVLQVPHHGAKDNFEAVLNSKIEAVVNVLSFGYGNRHRHPHVSTIDYFTGNNKKYFCVTQNLSYEYIIE